METETPIQPVAPSTSTVPQEPAPVVPVDVPVSTNKKFPLVPLLIVALIVIVGFMFLRGKSTQPAVTENLTDYSGVESTADVENQLTSTEVNTTNDAGTTSEGVATYTNTKHGYQLQFPTDWKAIGLVPDTNKAPASEDSDSVDIQSPDLTLGNVTLSVVSARPEKRADQAIAIEVFKNYSFTSYTSQTDGMVSRSFYAQLKNGQLLEILTRPVTASNQQIFESMMDSFQVL